MKNLFLKSMHRAGMGLVCLSVLFLSGCLNGDDDVTTEPQSFVTFYHASPDASSMDVYLNGTKINSQPFEYSNYSGYVNFDAGNAQFQFTPQNSTSALAESIVSLKVNTSYSLFLIDRLNEIDTWFVRDTSAVASAGKARVRLVHLSPDGGSLNVGVTGETTSQFTNRLFKTATDFIEVDAKTYSFDIRTPGTNAVLKTVQGIILTEGKYYTLAIKGFATPPSGNSNSLTLQLLPN
jgi:hypothetical protein